MGIIEMGWLAEQGVGLRSPTGSQSPWCLICIFSMATSTFSENDRFCPLPPQRLRDQPPQAETRHH